MDTKVNAFLPLQFQKFSKQFVPADESVINKVETFNKSYRLVEKGAILNWFDVESPEGYFSLFSRMGNVIATETGNLMFMPVMEKLFGGQKKNSSNEGDSAKLLGFNVPPPMLDMMGGFTILHLLTIMNGTMKVEITKEDLLELNANLNKLKKPD